MFFETTLTQSRSDELHASGHWKDRLLNDAVDEFARVFPDKVAVVDARGRVPYGELRSLRDRAALAFLDLGVRRNDVVTVQLPNWHEFVIAALALERIGAVINPVAPILRHREMAAILGLARPTAVVIPTRFRNLEYASMYRELLAAFPGAPAMIEVGPDPGPESLSWADFLAKGDRRPEFAPALDWLRPGGDDVVELVFTSGTTGEPKGAMHTPNTLSSGVEPMIREHRFNREDVCHMSSTLGHQTGFLYGMHLPLRIGARVIFQETWNAAQFLELVERERITYTMGATPFLSDTLAAPDLEKRDTGSLRLFVCGGAPIPRSLAEAAAKRLSCRLSPGWGMTEVGLVTSVLSKDPDEKVIASDGRAFPGMEVSIRSEAGSAPAPGEEGDLFARGPATFVGYVQGRAFTESGFSEGGWFATGDRARLDPDGFIRITGRTKDLIVRGGENVPVKEVEDLLLRHPSVHGVALIPIPDPRLGEIGCAFVILEDSKRFTLEDMRIFLEAQRLTRQFWPERLEIVEEFPMTPSGKIQKFRLRERFAVG